MCHSPAFFHSAKLVDNLVGQPKVSIDFSFVVLKWEIKANLGTFWIGMVCVLIRPAALCRNSIPGGRINFFWNLVWVKFRDSDKEMQYGKILIHRWVWYFSKTHLPIQPTTCKMLLLLPLLFSAKKPTRTGTVVWRLYGTWIINAVCWIDRTITNIKTNSVAFVKVRLVTVPEIISLYKVHRPYLQR